LCLNVALIAKGGAKRSAHNECVNAFKWGGLLNHHKRIVVSSAVGTRTVSEAGNINLMSCGSCAAMVTVQSAAMASAAREEPNPRPQESDRLHRARHQPPQQGTGDANRSESDDFVAWVH
jgi:hypothetical protein